MARTLELLLTENVEGTGIVGDVVKVRKGYARNYLLPRNFATTPSPEKVKELAKKREDAQKALAALRKEREGIIAKLEGHAINLIRSCNDLGILYGGITQTDIVDSLVKDGFKGIKQRDVRIGAVIKRVGDYDVHIKFEADLEATVKLHIKPDRELETGRRDDKPAEPAPAEAAAEGAAPAAKADGKPEAKPEGKKAKGEKPAKAPAEAPATDAKPEGEAKPEGKKAKGEKAAGEKGGKKDEAAAPAANKPKTGWGASAEVPSGLADLLKPKRERRERR